MKIIDFAHKGNVVRFYLGNDDENDYHGDDWNDAPYELNAGPVYSTYITGYKDISFPFEYMVLEPGDGVINSSFSKNDMKDRKVPCIIAIPPERQEEWNDNFGYYIGVDGIRRFYFGDTLNED